MSKLRVIGFGMRWYALGMRRTTIGYAAMKMLLPLCIPCMPCLRMKYYGIQIHRKREQKVINRCSGGIPAYKQVRGALRPHTAAYGQVAGESPSQTLFFGTREMGCPYKIGVIPSVASFSASFTGLDKLALVCHTVPNMFAYEKERLTT